MLDWQKVIDGILAMRPGPIRLKNPQWRGWILFAASIAHGAAAALLVSSVVDGLTREHRLLGALLVLPFAALLAMAVRELRTPHMLVLDDDGFQFVHGDDVQTYPWAGAEAFRVILDCGQFRTVFRHDGRDITVSADYGMPATPLCMLLEQWRAEALRTSGALVETTRTGAHRR